MLVTNNNYAIQLQDKAMALRNEDVPVHTKIEKMQNYRNSLLNKTLINGKQEANKKIANNAPIKTLISCVEDNKKKRKEEMELGCRIQARVKEHERKIQKELWEK